MQIKMLGIDHSRASLEYRELFSFTTAEVVEGLKFIKAKEEVLGCLILSTCNRTEVWVSCKDKDLCDLGQYLCQLKQVNKEEYDQYFVVREGNQALEHLLVTACGINSKVFGEDQIITQIREALQLSRKNKCTDKIIEKVFQNSIAAAKKVKTSVKLTSYNPSVADSGVRTLKKAYGDLKGKKCLVIGNGKMGALIADQLVSLGADVSMTLRRKYHHGEAQESLIPSGCTMVPFEDRISVIPEADIVISATLSPHYTVSLADIKELDIKAGSLWLDLAVPRDIDPNIGRELDIDICDIDDLESNNLDAAKLESVEEAKAILGGYREDIEKWITFRKKKSVIDETVKLTKEDTLGRLKNTIKSLELDEEEAEKLTVNIEAGVGRAINKLICGLKETLPEEYWDICFNALRESAHKDTMKK